jgi:hypothetical protein
MSRNNRDDDWTYYGDDRISSIYLDVYNKVLALPGTSVLKQTVIDKLDGTTVSTMVVIQKDGSHYGGWTPNVKFFIVVPGVRDHIETDTSNTPEIQFTLNTGDFKPCDEAILELFAQNVGEEYNHPIHMHGLMNMYSVKNGTQGGKNKGGKNKFVPWFLNKILKGDEITEAKKNAEARLLHEAYKFLNNPDFNAEYIEARNSLGKKGVIEQLKNLKHLPLEVLKEALNEFLCMDVMDGFDE